MKPLTREDIELEVRIALEYAGVPEQCLQTAINSMTELFIHLNNKTK